MRARADQPAVWVHQPQSAEAIAIPGLRWDGGAPLPVVVATDYRTLFACYEAGPEESVVVAEFVQCTSVRLGLPNDEVLHGHPCGNDLRGYDVFAILNSRWLDELRAIEAVHPLSANHPLQRSRHFFLVFHDSSLEAVATDLVVLGRFPSMPAAVAHMVDDLRLR